MRLFRGKAAAGDDLAAVRTTLAKGRAPASVPNLRKRMKQGEALFEQADWPAAERYYTELIPALTDTMGPRSVSTLASWADLATCQTMQGRAAEAIPVLAQTAQLFRETWGAQKAGTFQTQLVLADACTAAAQYEDALAVLDACLAYCAAEVGLVHKWSRLGRQRKVYVLRILARFEEAENELRVEDSFAQTDEERDTVRALQLVVRAESGATTSLAPMRELFVRRQSDLLRECLATVLLEAGQAAEAADHFRALLDGLPVRSRNALHLRAALARACVENGELDEAEHAAQTVLAAAAWPSGHPMTLSVRATVARIAARRGDRAGAVAELQAVAAGLTAVFGDGHPDVAQVVAWQAEC